MIEQKNMVQEKKDFIFILIFAVITVALWQFQLGRYILYPFTILGTWFHEMSHGICALVLGGTFHKLELNPDGSGLAVFSGILFLGNIGNAITAAAGPVGPSIAGAVFIISSKNQKMTKVVLLVLAFLLLISDIIWVRTGFGFLVILFLGLGIGLASLKAGARAGKLILQFLGVQACVSVYLSIGYLFSDGGIAGERVYQSDTAVISNNLFLPFWIWGILILAFSTLIILGSLRVIYSEKMRTKTKQI